MTSRERSTHLASCSVVLAAIAVGACGGGEISPKSAPPPASPSPPAEFSKDRAEPEPATVEEAQDQIARARAELESRSTSTATDGTKKSERAELPAKAPSTTPTSPSTPPQGGPTSREEKGADYDACSHPCRALASMKRAVESLCRMTGDTDNRCVDAKRTLSESTSRVASCRCT